AEPLVARDIGDAARATVETRQLVVADEAEIADAVTVHVYTAPTARAHDTQLGLTQLCATEGLDQRFEVLARLQRRDGEHVIPLARGAFPAERGSDRVPTDVHFLGRHAQQFDELAFRE